MSRHDKVWAAAVMLGFACVLASVETTVAQTTSKFQGKAIELKLKNGKVSYPGAITDGDETAFNRYYKLFTVELEKGKTYRIDHRDRGDDPKFDAYLFLEDAAGEQIEADNDGGGDLHSRIVFKVSKTGTYRIIATTLVQKQTGDFSLDIGAASAAEAKLADLKFRIRTFADISPVQRKNLAQQVNKHLLDKADGLAVADFMLVSQLAVEAELEDVDLARTIYQDALKVFDGAASKQLAAATRQLQSSLKNLDKIGKELDISGTTLDGKEFDLKKLKGKVILVDFWGTWCGPCIAEMPNIVKAYKKYHGKGFEVIGVARDKNDEIVTKFMEARKLPWACINVEDSLKMIKLHGINAYPSPMLVDADGRVISLRARGPQLERLLERLLGERK